MTLSSSKGGTKEFTSVGETYRHFLAASLELSSPKVLVCPLDKNRILATTFSTNFAEFNNSNISYFVGLDADEIIPGMLLTGDRNLTNNPTPKGPIMMLNARSQIGWTKGLHSAKSKDACGNIGLADGSAYQITTYKLREALGHNSNEVQRIMLP